MWSSVSSKYNCFMSLADAHGIEPFQNAEFLFDGVPLYWFSLNWRPSTRAERTLGPEALRFKKAWGMLKVIGGKGQGRKINSAPDDHSSHTRPVIPGELDASRARVCFTG